MVQQNAANAEENASVSEELSAQAGNLQDMVRQLLILVHGKIEQKYENLTRQRHRNQQNNTSQRQLPEKRTKLVSPEEVIPPRRR